MTGVLNRSGLEKAYASLMETKSPFYILVGDLNGTKSVNDTFGHIEGDRYIRRVTEIITAVIGSRGYLGRIGGDEFVIILEYINHQELENIISDIKNQVYAIYKVAHAGISIGCSEYPKDGQELSKLMEIADKKMYSDKKMGGCSRK
jgi:diguanylate cyclase (GGDEF)-like protein